MRDPLAPYALVFAFAFGILLVLAEAFGGCCAVDVRATSIDLHTAAATCAVPSGARTQNVCEGWYTRGDALPCICCDFAEACVDHSAEVYCALCTEKGTGDRRCVDPACVRP